jgi:hypothetical protein
VKRAELALGAALCLLIVALHLVVLRSAGALWRDEVNSVRFAQMPTLSGSFDMLRYYSLPMGETVALRAWSSLTATDQGFRVFGFLAGLGIVAALVWSGRMLGVPVPLLSLALFEISPMVLRFGDSIRPYGLGTLFVVTTAGLVRKLVHDDDVWVRIAAPISAILAVQFLYQNAFLILGICAGGIAIAARAKDWKRAGLVLGAGVLAALSLLPYLGKIRAAGEWAPIAKQPTDFGIFLSIVSQALGASGSLLVWVWAALILGALALVVVRRERDTMVFCGVAMAVSIVAFVAFVVVLDLNTQPWYLLPLMALAAVCVDAIYGVVGKATARIAVVALLVLLALPVTWPAIHERFTNVDTIAAFFDANAKPGDAIVVSPWYFGVSVHHAYRGPVPVATLPPMRDISIHRYDLLGEAMTTPEAMRPVLDMVAGALRAGKRVYVVGDLTFPQEGQPPPVLPPVRREGGEWPSGRYLDSWMAELGYLLRMHARDGRLVKLEERGPVSIFESLPVAVFEGWR